MATYGTFEVTGELWRGPTGSAWRARAAGESGEGAYVVRTFRAPTAVRAMAVRAGAGERFKRRGELQLQMAGAPNWAPVHEVGEESGEVFVVRAYAPRTARALIDGAERVGAADLKALVTGICRALNELRRRAGRAHGRVTPGNVLITSARGGVGESEVWLTDLSADEQADLDGAFAGDLRAVGELIEGLVVRPANSGAGTAPDVAEDPWEGLGSAAGGFWKGLAADLRRAGETDDLRHPLQVLQRVGQAPEGGRRRAGKAGGGRWAAAAGLVGVAVVSALVTGWVMGRVGGPRPGADESSPVAADSVRGATSGPTTAVAATTRPLLTEAPDQREAVVREIEGRQWGKIKSPVFREVARFAGERAAGDATEGELREILALGDDKALADPELNAEQLARDPPPALRAPLTPGGRAAWVAEVRGYRNVNAATAAGALADDPRKCDVWATKLKSAESGGPSGPPAEAAGELKRVVNGRLADLDRLAWVWRNAGTIRSASGEIAGAVARFDNAVEANAQMRAASAGLETLRKELAAESPEVRDALVSIDPALGAAYKKQKGVWVEAAKGDVDRERLNGRRKARDALASGLIGLNSTLSNVGPVGGAVEGGAAWRERWLGQVVKQLPSGDVDGGATATGVAKAQAAAKEYEKWAESVVKLGKAYAGVSELVERYQTTDPETKKDVTGLFDEADLAEKGLPRGPWSDGPAFVAKAKAEGYVGALKALRGVEGADRAKLAMERYSGSPVGVIAWRELGDGWVKKEDDWVLEAALAGKCESALSSAGAKAGVKEAAEALSAGRVERWRGLERAMCHTEAGVEALCKWLLANERSVPAGAVSKWMQFNRVLYGYKSRQSRELEGFTSAVAALRGHKAVNDSVEGGTVGAGTTAPTGDVLKTRGLKGAVSKRKPGTPEERDSWQEIVRPGALHYTPTVLPGDIRGTVEGIPPVIFRLITPRTGEMFTPFYISTTEVSIRLFDEAARTNEAAFNQMRRLLGLADNEVILRKRSAVGGLGPVWQVSSRRIVAYNPLKEESTNQGKWPPEYDNASLKGSHPIQYVSPGAALFCARLLNCRMPTPDEWKAAYLRMLEEAKDARKPLKTRATLHAWKLRDDAWIRTRTAMGRIGQIFSLDEDIFVAPGFAARVPRGQSSTSWTGASVLDTGGQTVEQGAADPKWNQQADWKALVNGTVLFRPVWVNGDYDPTTSYDLIGNVAEWAMEGPTDEVDRLPATEGAVEALLKSRPTALRVIGGSALSPWDPLESTCRHASLSIL